MANVLCHHRFTKPVLYVPAFEKTIAKKSALRKAMTQIDRAQKVRREASSTSKRIWSKPVAGGEKVVPAEAVNGLLEAAALGVEK
jgi:hypothetical protein